MPPIKANLLASCFLFAFGILRAQTTSYDDAAAGAFGQGKGIKQSFQSESTQSLEDILSYISAGWDLLTRSLTSCTTLADLKADSATILYLPAELPEPPELEALQSRCRVRVKRLPEKIAEPAGIDMSKIRTHGLLYLEHPYVVPGGLFNEMYGWDSYFIIRGLLRSGRRDLAQGMVDNFLFEVEHYGGVLNANRTYYLTRSQPPFLTSMILAVYRAQETSGERNLKWLERAYLLAARDYQQWNRSPHLAGHTGLSRYYDHGIGPVPEIQGDDPNYYRDVTHSLLLGGPAAHANLVISGPAGARPQGSNFEVMVCNAESGSERAKDCLPPDHVGLTEEFYKGDRSMRESGFDETFRFGPFGAETHHYAPVCLNSLLYKTERDLEAISRILGRRNEVMRWRKKALERKRNMVKYLWDPGRGLFFDYNFFTRKRSSYEYATTFYPLWSKWASKIQATAVARKLPRFEQPGGLAMSRTESGEQWDYPYGWAPIQLLAVEGLRNYGYRAAADRISNKFLETVLENFLRDHTIREKYNVVTKSVETKIDAGYLQNVIGFGWTNGVFLELRQGLPPEHSPS